VVLDCRCTNQHGETVAAGEAEVLAPTEAVELPRPDVGELSLQDHDKFEPLLAAAEALEPMVTAVAHPCSEATLRAAVEAAERRLIRPILVGPAAKLRAIAASTGLDLAPYRIVDAPHSHASADAAVALVRAGEAELLMKGSLHTDELLAAVVARAHGLRTERRLSHVFLMDVPTYPKLLMITDAAINIVPTLEEKRDICQNAIDLARALGISRPKVAILSAVETVNPKMPSTTDAASLCKMADRGQITGGVLDGPLAMDNAISAEAAAVKGIRSEVAGDPDILLVPDLEAGNILAKQLTFMANADAAGVVVGARVPIVLTSRADSVRARLASCAVAVLLARARRAALPKAV
jgi:phosphotransacetylase